MCWHCGGRRVGGAVPPGSSVYYLTAVVDGLILTDQLI